MDTNSNYTGTLSDFADNRQRANQSVSDINNVFSEFFAKEGPIQTNNGDIPDQEEKRLEGLISKINSDKSGSLHNLNSDAQRALVGALREINSADDKMDNAKLLLSERGSYLKYLNDSFDSNINSISALTNYGSNLIGKTEAEQTKKLTMRLQKHSSHLQAKEFKWNLMQIQELKTVRH